MSKGFDIAASTYDKDFTHSNIGRMQRDKVWKFLDIISNTNQSLNILELNCGTGEDAIRLAKQGNKVLASDISEGMLAIARNKSESSMVNFQRIDLNNIENFHFEMQFDLVFSNFGGLNCIDANTMSNLNQSLNKIMRSKGKYIAVIMPRFCLWETCFYLIKGKVKDAFRRQKTSVIANVSGNKVETWYYSPKNHQSKMGSTFKKEKLQPVGLFIPPSYLENFFSKRLRFLNFLQFLEKHLAIFSWQAKLADHYYIEYSKK